MTTNDQMPPDQYLTYMLFAAFSGEKYIGRLGYPERDFREARLFNSKEDIREYIPRKWWDRFMIVPVTVLIGIDALEAFDVVLPDENELWQQLVDAAAHAPDADLHGRPCTCISPRCCRRACGDCTGRGSVAECGSAEELEPGLTGSLGSDSIIQLLG